MIDDLKSLTVQFNHHVFNLNKWVDTYYSFQTESNVKKITQIYTVTVCVFLN